MLTSTRGIVLHHIKYTDSRIIAYIYTDKFGRQTYILRGAANKRSGIRKNLIQPLFLLDMEVYYKEKREIQSIKELIISEPFNSIPFDTVKSTVALFIAEILYKSLKEHTPNPQLFEFLFNAIQKLDKLEKGIHNYHILFLIILTRYLGFFPNGKFSGTTDTFDMLEGSFTSGMIKHGQMMSPEISEIFSRLLEKPLDEVDKISLSHSQREQLLEKLIEYYQIQLISMKEVTSYKILKSVFE